MEEKHSSVGIASFVISVIVAVLVMLVFIVAGILHNRTPEGPYPGQSAIGYTVIFLLFADLAAVGLGVASLCQKAVRKIFGVFGLVISSLTVLGLVAVIIFGMILMLMR